MKKSQLEEKIRTLEKEIEYQRGVIQELRTVITPPTVWQNSPDFTYISQDPIIYPTFTYQTDITST